MFDDKKNSTFGELGNSAGAIDVNNANEIEGKPAEITDINSSNGSTSSSSTGAVKIPFANLGGGAYIQNVPLTGDVHERTFKVMTMHYMYTRYNFDKLMDLVYQQTDLLKEGFKLKGNLKGPPELSVKDNSFEPTSRGGGKGGGDAGFLGGILGGGSGVDQIIKANTLLQSVMGITGLLGFGGGGGGGGGGGLGSMLGLLGGGGLLAGLLGPMMMGSSSGENKKGSFAGYGSVNDKNKEGGGIADSIIDSIRGPLESGMKSVGEMAIKSLVEGFRNYLSGKDFAKDKELLGSAIQDIIMSALSPKKLAGKAVGKVTGTVKSWFKGKETPKTAEEQETIDKKNENIEYGKTRSVEIQDENLAKMGLKPKYDKKGNLLGYEKLSEDNNVDVDVKQYGGIVGGPSGEAMPTVVGEQGPELVGIQSGSVVEDAKDTGEILENSSGMSSMLEYLESIAYNSGATAISTKLSHDISIKIMKILKDGFSTGSESPAENITPANIKNLLEAQQGAFYNVKGVIGRDVYNIGAEASAGTEELSLFSKISKSVSNIMSGGEDKKTGEITAPKGSKEWERQQNQANQREAGKAPSRMGKGKGTLAEKYESGGRGAGTVSSGKGDAGGVSYGTYQMSSETVKSFVENSQYKDEFSGMDAGSEEFSNKWKELADREGESFGEAQEGYVEQQNVSPIADFLYNDFGIDLSERSKTLNDVMFSLGVQHGPGGAKSLLKTVLANFTDPTTISDKELIRAIYAERSAPGEEEGTLKYFGKNSKDVQKSVANRFKNEEQDAMEMLEGEGEQEQEDTQLASMKYSSGEEGARESSDDISKYKIPDDGEIMPDDVGGGASGGDAGEIFWPPASGRLTSKFGPRKNVPEGGSKEHGGIDIGPPTPGEMGEPIHAMADGEVVYSGEMSGYGNVVFINHKDGTQSRYAHLNNVLVSSGMSVGAGTMIGQMGATSGGKIAGMKPHLHFEILNDPYNKSDRIDPETVGSLGEKDSSDIFEAGTSTPISSGEEAQFGGNAPESTGKVDPVGSSMRESIPDVSRYENYGAEGPVAEGMPSQTEIDESIPKEIPKEYLSDAYVNDETLKQEPINQLSDEMGKMSENQSSSTNGMVNVINSSLTNLSNSVKSMNSTSSKMESKSDGGLTGDTISAELKQLLLGEI